MFTEEQIERGFWYWNMLNDFPPESITKPDEYEGQSKVNIACTQRLDLTAGEQKKLVRDWIDYLPSCKNIEMLWFTTHTPQQLFDSVCRLENLVGLKVKWSNIKSLDNLSALRKLRYLGIGSSSQVQSILPLTEMTQLQVLFIENFKRITDFSPLVTLKDLRFLSIEGGMYTKQKVDTFEPISELSNLIHFSAVMISCPDKRIDPILKLKKLKALKWFRTLPTEDIDRLKSELPNLKYFPGRYSQEI
ncbi:MAG: hypothetical protein IPL32_11720 [Chloracidobacterium sp.]|nr:hypothetical protein [Chloracidobacterium sp.]